jgi:tubulin polyglutamylase TTLL1
MTNNKHSFESYGYDFIVDNNLKPWLIEVNSSLSLKTTTVNDFIMKNKLIDNILSVILSYLLMEFLTHVGINVQYR